MTKNPRLTRLGGSAGFTLVELVLALAILGMALTYLIFLRLDAVKKVTAVVEERELRRLAQEALEEKMAEFLQEGIVEEIVGEFPDRPGWVWEWIDPLDPMNIIQEGEEFLLACAVRLTYPDPDDPEAEERTYELTTWILPTEDQLEFILEQQELMYEEGGYGLGNAYGADPYGDPYGGAYAY